MNLIPKGSCEEVSQRLHPILPTKEELRFWREVPAPEGTAEYDRLVDFLEVTREILQQEFEADARTLGGRTALALNQGQLSSPQEALQHAALEGIVVGVQIGLLIGGDREHRTRWDMKALDEGNLEKAMGPMPVRGKTVYETGL